MLLLQIFTIAVLLTVFVQDISSRSVYWILFPLLATLFINLRLLAHQPEAEIWHPALINCGFLLVQLLLVSAYFSLKKGYWVNITTQLLGWGDILLLICTALYLSVINFLFFYVFSLVVSLSFWLIWQLLVNKKSKEIPLAGLQAFIFTVFLASDWWYLHHNLTDDNWLLHLMIK